MFHDRLYLFGQAVGRDFLMSIYSVCVVVSVIVIGSIDFAVDVDADGKLSGICCSVFMYSVPTMKNTNKKNTISIMGIIMIVGSF